MYRIKNELKCLYYCFRSYPETRIISDLIGDVEKPIYHFHVRKTAGTSLNFAFLSNGGNSQDLFQKLLKKWNKRIVEQDKIFVGWNTCLLNKGQFHFAFSHTPHHQIKIPKHVYTFTCLRDPVERILSHYNMLLLYRKTGVFHSGMRQEIKWLGKDFGEFLTNVPKNHLLNQLYMFSKKFDLAESIDVLEGLNKVIFTEDLERGIKELENDTGWTLPLYHIQKNTEKALIGAQELIRLRDVLKPEYDLIDRLKGS